MVVVSESNVLPSSIASQKLSKLMIDTSESSLLEVPLRTSDISAKINNWQVGAREQEMMSSREVAESAFGEDCLEILRNIEEREKRSPQDYSSELPGTSSYEGTEDKQYDISKDKDESQLTNTASELAVESMLGPLLQNLVDGFDTQQHTISQIKGILNDQNEADCADILICLGQEGEKVRRLKAILKTRFDFDASYIINEIENESMDAYQKNIVVADINYHIIHQQGSNRSEEIAVDGEDHAVDSIHKNGSGKEFDDNMTSQYNTICSSDKKNAARNLDFSSSESTYVTNPLPCPRNKADICAKHEACQDRPQASRNVLTDINFNIPQNTDRQSKPHQIKKKRGRRNGHKKETKNHNRDAIYNSMDDGDTNRETENPKRNERRRSRTSRKKTLIVFDGNKFEAPCPSTQA